MFFGLFRWVLLYFCCLFFLVVQKERKKKWSRSARDKQTLGSIVVAPIPDKLNEHTFQNGRQWHSERESTSIPPEHFLASLLWRGTKHAYARNQSVSFAALFNVNDIEKKEARRKSLHAHPGKRWRASRDLPAWSGGDASSITVTRGLNRYMYIIVY